MITGPFLLTSGDPGARRGARSPWDRSDQGVGNAGSSAGAGSSRSPVRIRPPWSRDNGRKTVQEDGDDRLAGALQTDTPAGGGPGSWCNGSISAF